MAVVTGIPKGGSSVVHSSPDLADRFRHIEFRPAPVTPRARRDNKHRTCRTWPSPFESACLQPDQEAFLQRLLAAGGVDREQYRGRPLGRRLASCLRTLRASSVQDANARLAREPRLLAAALDAVLIGVTSFFRDEPVFEAMHQEILPQLLEHGSRVRIWSAGCSDGAELYSVAMLMDELGGLPQADLLGTDCRCSAVETARLGQYPVSAVEGIEPRRRERYFVRTSSGRQQIISSLRDACHWRMADVFACEHSASMDLVLCRNLAIYLEPGASAKLWRRLVGAVRPGGYLVVGKAERPGRNLPLHQTGACIYCRGKD